MGIGHGLAWRVLFLATPRKGFVSWLFFGHAGLTTLSKSITADNLCITFAHPAPVSTVGKHCTQQRGRAGLKGSQLLFTVDIARTSLRPRCAVPTFSAVTQLLL